MTLKKNSHLKIETDGKNAISNSVIAGAVVGLVTHLWKLDEVVAASLYTLVNVLLIYALPVFNFKMMSWQKKSMGK